MTSRWPYKMTVEDIARTDERARRQARGFVMRCPAHDDSRASLSVTRLDNGFAFWKCFVGCSQADIAAALMARGIRNEWDERTDREQPRNRNGAVAKVTHHLVRDFFGEPVADHVRFDYVDGSKGFETNAADGSRLGVKLADLLYGLDLVGEYPDKLVTIVEGEKAADALRGAGATVVCGTLGASIAPSPALVGRFSGKEVILWPDNDDGGKRQMETWRKALLGVADKVTLLNWPGAPAKGDAYDFIAAGGTLDEVAELAAASPSWASPKIPAGTRYLWQGLDDALKILDRFSSGDETVVIPTGFRTVDRALRGGFEPGEVYLVGAPTGGGKTTIMQDFATRIAGRGPVLFVTPEMTLASMALRALVRDANLDTNMGVGIVDVGPWQSKESKAVAFNRLRDSYVALAQQQLEIVIYDDPEATMASIEDVARKVRGLKAIIIDYAQQVAGMDHRTPRYLQVGEVATRSTVLAKSLNVPVLLASQVNKSVSKEDGGSDKRPAYTFRETALLAHKASVVLIFDRAKERDYDKDDEERVECLLRCAKNRHGQLFKTLALDWYPAAYKVQQPSDEEVMQRMTSDAAGLPPAPLSERQMSLVAVGGGDLPPAMPSTDGNE